jgi:hypothetical protein
MEVLADKESGVLVFVGVPSNSFPEKFRLCRICTSHFRECQSGLCRETFLDCTPCTALTTWLGIFDPVLRTVASLTFSLVQPHPIPVSKYSIQYSGSQ